MTPVGSETRYHATEEDFQRQRITLHTGFTEAWTEIQHIRDHIIYNTLASSPLIPKPLRWCLYRIGGLKIFSPNVAEQCVIHARSIEIGRGVFVNRACYFEGYGRIKIGEDSQIGPQCTFLTSHHDASMVCEKLLIAKPIARDIIIGARVWIGGRSTFLPGSSVEDDVVVAAGAVVSGHLSHGWVYGGVPAKRIRPIQELSSDASPTYQ
jgi:maltose O-acetyltransferase